MTRFQRYWVHSINRNEYAIHLPNAFMRQSRGISQPGATSLAERVEADNWQIVIETNMEFLISLILAVKGLVLVGGMMASDRIPASIGNVQILASAQDVRMVCSLNNAWNTQLRKLAQTGTPILVYLFVECRQSAHDSLMSRICAENRLEYDLIDKHYHVVQDQSPDTLSLSDLDSALMPLAQFRTSTVIAKSSLSDEQSYYFAVYCVLGKTTIEALDNKTIDLMYFWRYKRPSVRTEEFSGGNLRAAGAGQ